MSFHDASSESQDRMLGASIEFLASITEVFGTDKGYEVWDGIASLIGQELKDAMFMTMLQGRTAGGVTIRGLKGNEHASIGKVEAIKCIRNYTGLGLKESKDIADAIFMGADKKIDVRFTERLAAVKDLKTLGFSAY